MGTMSHGRRSAAAEDERAQKLSSKVGFETSRLCCIPTNAATKSQAVPEENIANINVHTVKVRTRKLKSGGDVSLSDVAPPYHSDLFGENEIGGTVEGVSRESAYWSLLAKSGFQGQPAFGTMRSRAPHSRLLAGELHDWCQTVGFAEATRCSAENGPGQRVLTEGSHRTRRLGSGGCGAFLFWISI